MPRLRARPPSRLRTGAEAGKSFLDLVVLASPASGRRSWLDLQPEAGGSAAEVATIAAMSAHYMFHVLLSTVEPPWPLEPFPTPDACSRC